MNNQYMVSYKGRTWQGRILFGHYVFKTDGVLTGDKLVAVGDMIQKEKDFETFAIVYVYKFEQPE